MISINLIIQCAQLLHVSTRQRTLRILAGERPRADARPSAASRCDSSHDDQFGFVPLGGLENGFRQNGRFFDHAAYSDSLGYETVTREEDVHLALAAVAVRTSGVSLA